MERKKLGQRGEDTAVRYIEKKGYCLQARNYWTCYGELDIVCSCEQTLVFIEVKTRTSQVFGSPEEAVTPRKIDHIKKAALLYLQQEGQGYSDLRFDVITILIKQGRATINHIENAF